MKYDKYTFFYGGPFSQWAIGNFTVGEVEYNCAEQYMMHQKALLFGDQEIAGEILCANHPREQKALGRKVRNFDAGRWNAIARELVYKGNYAKFQQNPEMLDALNETKGTLLVEASPTDKIWGIGLSTGDKRINDPANWRGTNWLGEVLTQVRDDLEAGVYRTEGFEWSWPET